MTLGSRVKARREELGLSQETLAARAGLTRQGLANVEHDRGRPRWETMLAIAHALGLHPSDLAGHGPTPEPEAPDAPYGDEPQPSGGGYR